MLSSLRRCVGAGVLLALVMSLVPRGAGGPVEAQEDRGPHLFSPSGEYPVGRTQFQWVDDTRDEVHTTDPGDRRELLVEVWYPASPEDGADYGTYLEAPMADLWTQLYSPPEGRLHVFEANAFVDAPLAGDQAAYPVVIFDPGFSAAPRQYTIMIEELASHGYVVFSPSHPYVTMLTVFPDGRTIEPLSFDRIEALWDPVDLYEGEFKDVWVPDVRFVMDQIEALNAADPAGRFAGRLALDDGMGLIGHSQGARTVSEVCLIDDRCSAAINLDGGYSAAVELAFDKPYMRMLADNGVEDLIAAFQHNFEALATDYYVLMIPHTYHMNFADSAFWVPVVFDGPPPEGTGAAQIALMDYREYALAFMDRYMRGLEAPLLDGPSPAHPEVFFFNREDAITLPTAGVDPQTATQGANRGGMPIGSADVWTFEAQAGDVIAIDVLADRPADRATAEQRIEYFLMDTLLAVYAPDGSLLAANDDMDRGLTNSRITGLALPEDGSYRIEVRTWANQSGGDYTLLIDVE